MQLRPDTLVTIFIAFLLILPGFLSQIIINSLVKQNETSNSYQTTYGSLLHSIVIYTILYPLVVLFWGVNIQHPETMESLLLHSRWHPLAAIFILAGFSFGWALIYVWVKKTRLVTTIQNKFGTAVEPPNIYARILNPSYRQNDEPDKYWVTLNIGGMLVEGGVKYQVTTGNCREVFLTNVIYLDPETRKEILRLPDDTGVVIDLDKRCITEITGVSNKEVND